MLIGQSPCDFSSNPAGRAQFPEATGKCALTTMRDLGYCDSSAAFDDFEGSRGGTHPPAGRGGVARQRVPTNRRLALSNNHRGRKPSIRIHSRRKKRIKRKYPHRPFPFSLFRFFPFFRLIRAGRGMLGTAFFLLFGDAQTFLRLRWCKSGYPLSICARRRNTTSGERVDEKTN